jgi:hypothetical protein
MVMGNGGFLVPDYGKYANIAKTYQELEHNPLKFAVKRGHKYGIEI